MRYFQLPWRDGVIPFAMKIFWLEVECGHLGVRDFEALFVGVCIDPAGDVEAGFGGCVGNQLDDDLMAEQRFTAPVLGNEGEQAVLDLVPFAGAWRQMANSNGDAEFVGQDLQLAFPQAYPCAVAAAAIGIDQQTSCGRITRAAEFIPPAADALDGEGRRVMIDAEIDPSYVRGDVVDAVRHGLTEFRDHEVMHTNRLRLPLWPQFAAAILEVADKLPSRPGELHPEPLTEPDVRLSPHTA